ncbi:MAG: hypothetical protein JJT89_06570 [Nitriliruptoraceae bacterium]|nr:hypothetical protein [Nitriliruptoraceae bacterium]
MSTIDPTDYALCLACHEATTFRDCFGEQRCIDCDGDCPGCFDGGGPDID